ncbi:hypothetical protein LJC20_06280 [Eubacteriales bacterium OttesenSCG-928-M02]|nr:hypothetical protein [Eubacteriales bacterium OttesenSCG-928-M02]
MQAEKGHSVPFLLSAHDNANQLMSRSTYLGAVSPTDVSQKSYTLEEENVYNGKGWAGPTASYCFIAFEKER